MASPIGLEPLQNYLVPASGTTHGYRFTQTMEAARVYEISFRDFQLNGRAFAPSGVLIDNTRADGDVSIIINEVAYRIVCKKGEFLHLPYPAPLQQTVSLQGVGLTTVIFVDYPVLPFSSASGTGGGGGGSGGRSAMLHGFQGLTAGAGTANQWVDLPIVNTTIDPDGWLTGGKLIVPNGVEIIRLGGMTQAMVLPDGGRVNAAWQIRYGAEETPVNTTGTDPNIYVGEFVDFGFLNVNGGDEIIISSNSESPNNPVLALSVVIEVVQGAILNT